MDDHWWPGAREDLAAGEPDRANRTIDAVSDRDIADRLALADAHLDDLIELYRSAEDGYVRQSVIRVIEPLVPDIVGVVAMDRVGIDRDTIESITDDCAAFLLVAITDDDGRVRRAAIRGVKHVARTYDGLEDDSAIEALVEELDREAESADADVREHIHRAREDVRVVTRSGIARMIEGFQEELGERL